MQVLICHKWLAEKPQIPVHEAISIFRYEPAADAEAWLALRAAAFAGEAPPVGRWSLRDVQRELGSVESVRRPTWLARPSTGIGPPCGAISLTPPSGASNRAASVNWLMVDPAWRRCGVGSLLLATAEHYCWEQGWRALHLQTHREWRAAVRFYERHGYSVD